MIEHSGRKLSFIGKLLVLTALLAIVSFAQTSAPPPVTALPLTVPPVTAAPLVFEVTTVKQNKSGSSGSHSNFQDETFRSMLWSQKRGHSSPVEGI
jgi:hypothetical protein